MNDGTTIAALATAPAPAGIAVVRLSGPLAKEVLNKVFTAKSSPVSSPRKLCYGHIIEHPDLKIIEKALAVFMPAPHSYTGDDVVEFQMHGNPLIAKKLLRSLYSCGAEPAQPGEFTRRAFLNGKLDLIQAEAVCDLINATSDQALQIAEQQLEGRFSGIMHQLANPLRNALAEIEAAIDFPEEDIQPETIDSVLKIINDSRQQIDHLIKSYSYGHIVKEGFRVLLLGPPNVGKSSILNLLLGEQRAIVTEISGTTRDLIEEAADFSGHKFVFCDSAGIQETSDQVEKIGIQLANQRIAWADLVLFVVDASSPDQEWQNVIANLTGKAKKVWLLINKTDLCPVPANFSGFQHAAAEARYNISAKTGDGLEQLRNILIVEAAGSSTDFSSANVVVTNERQRNCLVNADHALSRAVKGCQNRQPPELISADLRSCLSAVEELIGVTTPDDILDRIFSRFCIGK